MKVLARPAEKYCCILYDTVRALSIASNRPAILGLLCEKATEALNVRAVSVRVLDKTGKALEPAAAYGLREEYLEKGPVEVEKSLVDKEALSWKTVAILDVTKDPRWQYPEEAKREGICSVLCVPVSVKQKAIGTVRAYSFVPREFTEDEKQFLLVLANQVAITIENLRLTEKLQRRYQDMCTLVDISRAISSNLSLERLLDCIVAETAEAMKVKGCALRLLDESGKELELSAAHGLSEQYLEKGSVEVEKSLKEIMKGKPVMIRDAATDPRVQYPEEAKKEGVTSILAVPVYLRDKIIGTIRVFAAEPRDFEEEDIEFLTGVAANAAIAIQNAKLYEIALTKWQELVQEISEKIDFWGPPR